MKPNVLLLIIDGLRTDKFFGTSKTSYTPNMDRLKKDGRYNWKIRFGPSCGFRDQNRGGSGYFLFESNTNILETY